MTHHRFRCFSPSWRWHRYYAYAYGGNGRYEEDERERTRERMRERFSDAYYEHRRGRGRHHGAGVGVRRPLRYLTYQLDLDESQRRRIARVLDDVKTAREQTSLDERKTLSAVADLVTGESVSADALSEALAPRTASMQALHEVIAEALREIAATLDPDQREEFAYLLRSDAFKI